jgi:hypothetical protein
VHQRPGETVAKGVAIGACIYELGEFGVDRLSASDLSIDGVECEFGAQGVDAQRGVRGTFGRGELRAEKHPCALRVGVGIARDAVQIRVRNRGDRIESQARCEQRRVVRETLGELQIAARIGRHAQPLQDARLHRRRCRGQTTFDRLNFGVRRGCGEAAGARIDQRARRP